MGTTAVYFINWGDNFVLRYYHDVVSFADIGIYNFGYQFFKGLTVFFSVVGVYFLPLISQHIDNPQKVREYLYSKRPKIFFIGVISLVAAYFVFPFGIKLIYGQTYRGGEAIFRILLIAEVMYIYVTLYAPVFNALKRYKFIETVNVCQVLANVILNIALIPVLGMYGAAVATVIAYIFQAAAFELYFRLKLKALLFGKDEHL